MATPRLDDLVTDPEFLLAAEPDRLLGLLDAVVEPEAVRVASAYRLAAAYLRDEPAEAASHLQLAARRVGAEQLADRLPCPVTAGPAFVDLPGCGFPEVGWRAACSWAGMFDWHAAMIRPDWRYVGAALLALIGVVGMLCGVIGP